MNINRAHYPIRLDSGWWVFCGFSIESGFFGIAADSFPAGDVIFGSPEQAMAECARRNLAKVISEGIADRDMGYMGKPAGYTYREHYERIIRSASTGHRDAH